MAQEKKSMTHEERLELAEKLDKELDDFINGLEKKQYTEGWPEDKWEEEMEKHPFFMKKSPEPGEELHPLLEGIQQLKYDPEENTAEELANTYKEDGNFNFKYKKYRLAVWSYTEGIKQKHNNTELKATLYNNRAASQYFLKNYRSCLRDCENALKLKSNYEKVLTRAANCCYHINNFEKCIDYCTQVLDMLPTHKEMLELRQKAVMAAKSRERDTRKREREDKKKQEEFESLLKEIKKRGVQFEGSVTDLQHLEPKFPEIANHRVYLDTENNGLVWPVIILYPEFKTMDFIQEFPESDQIYSQLSQILMTGLVWDDSKKYNVDNINVYYEQKSSRKLHHVSINITLGALLKQPGYFVSGGTPSLIVLAKGSPAEKHFLSNYNM